MTTETDGPSSKSTTTAAHGSGYNRFDRPMHNIDLAPLYTVALILGLHAITAAFRLARSAVSLHVKRERWDRVEQILSTYGIENATNLTRLIPEVREPS